MTITVENLVSREVHYCVSFLVSTMAGGYGSIENTERLHSRGREAQAALSEAVEQAFELCSPVIDWQDTAIEYGWKIVDRDPSADRQNDDPCLYHEEQDRVWPLGDWQGACEDLDVDPIEREVFEHWIVSDWLADRLAEKGEKVDKDFAGLTVWARTCTGQGIASDSVIEAIHADLVGEA